jgi:hypothetical protein
MIKDHAAQFSSTAAAHHRCFGVKETAQLLAEIEDLKSENKQLKLVMQA